MSFISSSDIINVVVLLFEAEDKGRCPDPKIFLCIRASAADAAAVNPKGISSNPVFSNGPRSLPRNPPDCTSCNILSPLFSLIRSIQWTSEFSKNYWRNI